jgi:hypothetical protein
MGAGSGMGAAIADGVVVASGVAWWSGTDVQGGRVPRARQARALPVQFRSGAAVRVGAYPAEPGPSLRA